MSRHCITFHLGGPHCGTTFGNCPFARALAEYLRYSGALAIKGLGHADFLPTEVETALPLSQEGESLLTVDCPFQLRKKFWAEQNLERLQSFGVKAIHWTEDELGFHIKARNFGPAPRKVVIEVFCGLAEVTQKPPDVEVEIIDHDLEEESDDEVPER